MGAAAAGLYRPETYQGELGFDEAQPGRVFPSFGYAVTQAHVEAYVAGVAGGLDPAALAAGAASPLLPSLVALNFGFVYSAMRCRPPTGFLNTALEIELAAPVAVDEPLVMTVSVVDSQIKRERKFVTLKAQVTRADGAAASSALIGCIFP